MITMGDYKCTTQLFHNYMNKILTKEIIPHKAYTLSNKYMYHKPLLPVTPLSYKSRS